MISLLADSNIQNYDIIVIQKSWRNFFDSNTLNSYQSNFHFLYKSRDDTRMCFYINDKINLDNWKIEYFSSDICILKLIIRIEKTSKAIYVNNVYNSFLVLYSSKDNSSSLSKINRDLVKIDSKSILTRHIFLKNFNLHHSFWSDFLRLTQHAIANELLNIVNEHDLMLTLLKNTITWEIRNTCSIIDLTFMSSYLTKRLKYYIIKSDLN
jgi:hypothetical protein